MIYEATLPSLNFVPSEECIEVRFVTAGEVAALEVISENLKAFRTLFDPAQHR